MNCLEATIYIAPVTVTLVLVVISDFNLRGRGTKVSAGTSIILLSHNKNQLFLLVNFRSTNVSNIVACAAIKLFLICG